MSSNHVEVQQKMLINTPSQSTCTPTVVTSTDCWILFFGFKPLSSFMVSNLLTKTNPKNQRFGSQSIWMKLIVDHRNYWLLKASRPAFTKVQIYRTLSSRNVVALGECSAGATKARPTATCNWKENLYPKNQSFFFFFFSLSLSVCIHMHILTDTLDWIGLDWIGSYIN